MAKENLALEGYSTKEIALQQKPINEVLKESEGVLISFTKANVKKNLTALVKKHSKEIDELIAKEQLTTKEETRLKELRAIHKEPRIALDKITKHNISVLAQTSKGIKVVKDDLTLIVEPVETKITERLDNEEKRREKQRQEKEAAEQLKKEKLEALINSEKEKLQLIIDGFSEFEAIEETIFNFENMAQIFRDSEKEEGIDVETVNLEFESAFETLSEALQAKIDTITTQYNLDQSNKALEVEKLKNERMELLFDLNYKYKGEKPLGEMTRDEFKEIYLKVRSDFRIEILEDELNFVGNEHLRSWIYATDTEVILVQISTDEIEKLNDEDFNSKIDFFKKEIEDWNNPKEEIPFTKTNEIQVESINGINEIISENEIEVKEEEIVQESETNIEFNEAENAQEVNVSKNDFVISGDAIKVVHTPLQRLKEYIFNQDKHDYFEVNKMIEFIDSDLLQNERANLIEAYNDGQTSSINLMIDEIEKEVPGLGKELAKDFEANTNKMDAVEYVNEKYGI